MTEATIRTQVDTWLVEAMNEDAFHLPTIVTEGVRHFQQNEQFIIACGVVFLEQVLSVRASNLLHQARNQFSSSPSGDSHFRNGTDPTKVVKWIEFLGGDQGHVHIMAMTRPLIREAISWRGGQVAGHSRAIGMLEEVFGHLPDDDTQVTDVLTLDEVNQIILSHKE